MIGALKTFLVHFHTPHDLSLRVRITLAILVPICIIFIAFMMMQYKLQQKMLMENMTLLASQTALTIEHSLQQAMLNHNPEDLQEILDSIGQNPMIRVVFLMDPTGKVVFSPNGHEVGMKLSNQDAACQPCHRLPLDQRPVSVVVTLAEGKRFFRSMNPIENQKACQGCHPPTQRINGVLMTDIAIEPLEASLAIDMWRHFILWGAAILVSMVVVNVVIDRFVLHRLGALSKAIKKLSSGQPSSPLPEDQADEIGSLSLAFNEMTRQIETRAAENQQLSEALSRRSQERGILLSRLITAHEDERKRIARELHDELGQALTVLALQIELATQSLESRPEQARYILDQGQNLVGETSDQMYNMILALRPSVLDDLGLAVALRQHAERIFGDSGVFFSLDASRLINRLPPDLEIVFYRVFQEALTNISRHAHARNVFITLSQENGSFLGEITDDGLGFDPAKLRSDPDQTQGLGLAGMQERVLLLNGHFEVLSQPGHGTRIKISIPVQEDSHG